MQCTNVTLYVHCITFCPKYLLQLKVTNLNYYERFLLQSVFNFVKLKISYIFKKQDYKLNYFCSPSVVFLISVL